MITISVLYFLILLATLSACYLLGTFVFFVAKISIVKPFTDLFARLVISLVLLVTGTSVYFTKGVTISCFYILIMVFLAILYWKKNISQKLHSFSHFRIKSFFVILFIGLLAFYIVRAGQIFSSSDYNIPLTPHADIVYYANCIDFLTYFGKENSSVDYVYGASSGTSPYHYFELWSGAFISRCFGVNSALSLFLVVFTFSLFLIWLGNCAILELFKVVKWPDALLCFLLVFVTGLYFDFYTLVPFMKMIGVFGYNTFNYAKIFPVYIFAISSFLFFHRNKNTEGILGLIAIPVAYISTSIGVFAGLFVWLFMQRLVSKESVKTFQWIITASIAIGIFCFYKFLTVQTNTHVSLSVQDMLNKMIELSFLRTAFNVCAGAILQIILLFSPFILLIFIAGIKPNFRYILSQNSVQLMLLCCFFSLLGWAILHDKLSTVQVFSNLSGTLLKIAATFLMLFIWSRLNVYKTLTVIIFGFLIVAGIQKSLSGYRVEYPQSAAYLNKTYSYSNQLSSVGGFLMDKEDYEKRGFGYVANFDILGKYLLYSKKRTFPLALSLHSYKLSNDKKTNSIEAESIKNTPFNLYVEEQKKRGIFMSVENSQIQFIEHMKINYLICTKNVVLPLGISRIVKNEITDTNTGERFLILK